LGSKGGLRISAEYPQLIAESNLFPAEKPARGSTVSWQGLLSLNGTFEEWVKKSDAEFAATEEEIRQIRELLDEE
jgi:hypothetical protein